MAEPNGQPAGSAQAPNGVHPPASQKPNPLRSMRPKQRTNPMVRRKPPPKTAQARPSANPAPLKLVRGSQAEIAEKRRRYGGWSEPPPAEYQDIPIMTTKKALLNGIRHHLLKFAPTKSGKEVDPTDQDEFTRPVTLHRRDARQPPPGRVLKEEPEPEPVKEVDHAEAERLAQIKAEKDAQRAADQAKIAPVLKDTEPKKKISNQNKKKNSKKDEISVGWAPKTEAAKKEQELRYEEALPWHLEDADGKNVWVGSYTAALSDTTVALAIDGGVFRMVPLEKWYRFTSKPPFQPYTIDQAEAMMNKKMAASRWVMKDDEKRAGLSDLEATRRAFYGRGPMIKTESDTFKAASRSEKMDHDELDLSGDEFQDDDENHTFDKQEDEDTKEASTRIRREQLGANLFGEGDEQRLEKELKEELQAELERQKYGKSTRKALIKRDREHIYESDDSNENPWSSSSSDDSSDEGEEKDEDGKKTADGLPGSQNDRDRDSGASTKGTTTPQKLRVPGVGKHGKSLKRAGSPNLSESSGNESSRKKPKFKTSAASNAGSRAGTPIPSSFGGAKRKGMAGGAGSGSDGEATGGEMSDGAGGRKKIRVLASNRSTPAASRAGSPNPPQGRGASPPGSPPAKPLGPREILEKIPDDGIASGVLLKLFHGRIGSGPGLIERAELIKMLKQLCDYGPDKKLRKKKDLVLDD